jgi:hypothetical protein
MHCTACDVALDVDDNYCRRCGAPVRMLAVAETPQRAAVVRVGPSAAALLAGAARPLATGAAAVAAGALVRFAMRRAARGIAGTAVQPRSKAGPRPVDRPTEQPSAPAAVQITEVYWYRRIVRTERT